MYKKIIVIAISFCMAFVLTACGGGSGGASEEASPEETAAAIETILSGEVDQGDYLNNHADSFKVLNKDEVLALFPRTFRLIRLEYSEEGCSAENPGAVQTYREDGTYTQDMHYDTSSNSWEENDPYDFDYTVCEDGTLSLSDGNHIYQIREICDGYYAILEKTDNDDFSDPILMLWIETNGDENPSKTVQ